jgi:hypothetical protein
VTFVVVVLSEAKDLVDYRGSSLRSEGCEEIGKSRAILSSLSEAKSL